MCSATERTEDSPFRVKHQFSFDAEASRRASRSRGLSARAIVSGALHKAAEERTSKAGKPFAILTIRGTVDGSTRWWQCICFNETMIEDLKELTAGEPLAVAGAIDAEIYAPAGSEGRLNWRITIDAVLSARKPKAKPEGTRRKPNAKRDAGSGDDSSIARGREIASRSWAAVRIRGKRALQ
jgi:hypothetical protein